MPTPERRSLQIMLTSSDESRVVFGLNMALAAAASEVRVVVFFALEAARFVCAAHEATSPGDLAAQLLSQGVELRCCSACMHDQCGTDSSGRVLIEGVTPAGLAEFVHRASGEYETVTL